MFMKVDTNCDGTVDWVRIMFIIIISWICDDILFTLFIQKFVDVVSFKNSIFA